MEFGTKVLLLLAFAAKLTFGQDCDGNMYMNNPFLITVRQKNRTEI